MAKVSVEQALAKAKSHIKKGETAEAQALYVNILKAFPNNKKAQQGLITLGGGQRSAGEQGPPQAVIDQLINLYNQGKLQLLVSQINQLLEQYTTSFVLWNILGVANKDLNKIGEAAYAFKKVTQLNPNYADGYNNLGVALGDQDLLDEAIRAYEKAIKLQPNFHKAHNNLGTVLRRKGKLDQAISSYKQAITIKSDYSEAYNNLGVAFAQAGNFREAMVSYDRAVLLRPNYAEVYSNMSSALKDVGKLKEAITAYDKSVSLVADATETVKSKYAEAYNEIGVDFKLQGDMENAIKAYNKALFYRPEFAESLSNLGNVLRIQGKLDEAIELYKKSLAHKPDYAAGHSDIGNALLDQGKLDEAIASHTKALAIEPNYFKAYSNLGNALLEQGKLEKAIEAYKKSLCIMPEYAEAARNLVKLPIGSIDEETILGLNKQFSILVSNIQDQSQRLFFEANLFTHKGEYEEAFKRFVEANHIKSNEIAPVVENLRKNYDTIVNRIQHWSPHSLKQTEPSLKKLFLLGPSRSGKSSLEKLLMRIPKIYPMYENISLNTLQESEVGSREVKSFDMAELFYHDEHRLLDDRYSFVTSTSPESMFYIDQLLDGLVNSFCVLVKRDRADVASEIFTQEYRNGNFFSYNHSSIQDYLNTYSVIWKEIKRKAPQRTLEIEYEDILMKPKEVLGQINDFTGEHLVLDNVEQYSTKNRISPFREHYAQKFRS